MILKLNRPPQSNMIKASLPMYDWPEIREHTDAFWEAFQRNVRVNLNLARDSKHSDLWRDPDLFFSQTCGYPFTHEFKGLLDYVATPHYICAGCEDAAYSSFIFARQATPLHKFRGKIPAVNSMDSMSGLLALKLVFASYAKGGEFFERKLITGGHLNSLKAVREGKADVCAIDAVCVALAKKYRPEVLEGLVIIAQSPMVPSLPFVTRAGDVDDLRTALTKTFADPELKATREALLLDGFSNLGEGAYDRITDFENNLPPFNL
jgi:ABC-type phosphate/phosphonate transport system substrate-binding protein